MFASNRIEKKLTTYGHDTCVGIKQSDWLNLYIDLFGAFPAAQSVFHTFY